MKKRINILNGKKDADFGILTKFHSDFQKRLTEKEDEVKTNFLSNKFASNFNEVLSRCFGTDKIQAESVYMQCMLNKDSVHIAKTRWKTLEDFVKYQGRLGSFLVDYCNKTWYVQALSVPSPRTVSLTTGSQTYISDSSSEKFHRALKAFSRTDVTQAKDEKSGYDSSKNKVTAPNNKISSDSSASDTNPKWTLKRSKVAFKVSPRTSPYRRDTPAVVKPQVVSRHLKKSQETHNRKSALVEIMEEQEKIRERWNRRGNWLQPGIIVRIGTDQYGKHNNRKRCRIIGMLSTYTGLGHVLATGDIITVDQKHLKTSIPEVGGIVRIVNGAYRDETGVLQTIRFKNDAGTVCCVRLTGSPLSGRLLKHVHCDDISEIYTKDAN